MMRPIDTTYNDISVHGNRNFNAMVMHSNKSSMAIDLCNTSAT